MIMYQAISTKYLGPTDKRWSRIRATAQAGSITIDYDQGLSSENNHAAAAKALAMKFGWDGTWFAGGLVNGNCFVRVPTAPDNAEGMAFYVSRS